MVINDWLAEDLRAQVDDELTMDYFVVESGSKLVEKRGVFTVKAIVKMEGPAADKRWMPDFPGVADVESARDWEPGLPLDLTRIRDKDDEYWESFKGTPKAFVSYQTGEEHWANRWGKVTGMRVPGGQVDVVSKSVRDALEPSVAGMQVMNFSEQAREAAKSPVDFAMLFLAMSFFLIIAAIALVTMLFRFNVEQRAEEGALLSALGISVKKIFNWRMGEAFLVVLVGALIGTLFAILFCKAFRGARMSQRAVAQEAREPRLPCKLGFLATERCFFLDALGFLLREYFHSFAQPQYTKVRCAVSFEALQHRRRRVPKTVPAARSLDESAYSALDDDSSF